MNNHGYFSQKEIKKLSNWSFLSDLDQFSLPLDHGYEVLVADVNLPIQHLLKRFRFRLSFSCRTQPGYFLQHRWLTLASNKYNQAIAGMVSSPEHKGTIIVLPRVADQSEFVEALLESALPDMAPHLFADGPSNRWLHDREYELPGVCELNLEIEQVQEETQLRIAELNRTVEAEGVSYGVHARSASRIR